ncbi:MAG: adenylate/guanylate cyclase domain-containing protein [Sphingomonadales bacterium]|nr:adenylate/guanylate cyclase domain-containing protein [Sphingomonadales bacterium]
MTSEARALLRRGELLAAYDSAVEGLRDKPDSTPLKHSAVLCLARAGAMERAQAEFERLGLDKIKDDEDVLALGGRLLKAVALEKAGDERRLIARAAAEKYARAYRQTGGFFSGINTASLLVVAGRAEEAEATAHQVLKSLEGAETGAGEAAYYRAATRAEAHLLLGDQAASEASLADALTRDPDNYTAHATTLKQLAMILEAQEADADWLDRFRPPKVAHFVGHMFEAGGERADAEEESVRAAVNEVVAAEGIGFGFGALAAGADIIMAKALLDAGAELHLVQPCPDDVFVETSVRPYGESWADRFERCRRHATVSYATGDRANFNGLDKAFSSQIAMGKAILRAQFLATEAVQIAVWDGKPAQCEAGTGHDVAFWRQTGLRQIILPFELVRMRRAHRNSGGAQRAGQPFRRKLMAMLFADTHGFGKLGDEQVLAFVQTVLGPLAQCCRELPGAASHFNTWGDGLFLAFDKIGDAARAALALQECFRSIDLAAFGLPDTLALRIGCHYGPVQEHTDPFLGRPNIFGNQVVIASRVEPETVPGSIYVTEPFASVLAASEGRLFRCEYVGEVEPRKGSDKLLLFSLRRTGQLIQDRSGRQAASAPKSSSRRARE